MVPCQMAHSPLVIHDIVNEQDLKNACELVSKAHEEMKETVEQSQNGSGVLNLVTK
jgi:hypothetical protein